jgi:uncharacterized protein YecT (DUF1311 family)
MTRQSHARTTSPIAALIAVMITAATPAVAQGQKADPKDTAAIEDCLKPYRANKERAGACVGVITDPCLKDPKSQSLSATTACHVRERLVWDDLLNKTYEQLRLKVDDPQWAKLRDLQKSWTEARKQVCEFYWEFFRGTAASPHAEGCYRRETAEHALYLMFFLDNAGRR